MEIVEKDKANKRNHLQQITNRLRPNALSQFKTLNQLNSEYNLVKHDLELLMRIKYITQNEMDEQMLIIEHYYVEAGLKIKDDYYED